MKKAKARGRAILAAGAAVQVLTGLPGAWGAFQKPVMAEFAFAEGQASLAFSLLIAGYGVGCAAGGFFQDTFGPRAAGLVGTALLCCGVALGRWLPAGQPWLFYLGFSLPAGVGSAFLYPAVQACAQKWYADQKGLAAGVVGCAVGASGLFLTLFVRWFTQKGPGLRAAFFWLAALMLPVCLGASLLLRDPPKAPGPKTGGEGLGPAQAVRTGDFWRLGAAVALSTPAVLLFSPILVQLAADRGLGEQAGLWAVMLGSVGNAAGRLAMPLASDKIGRRQADLWLLGGLAALSVGLWLAPGWWMLAVYAGLCFCYSGLAAVLPAFAADRFGLAHAGVNLGLLALGQTVGSLGFPLLAKALGLKNGRHWIAIGAALAGMWAVKGINSE